MWQARGLEIRRIRETLGLDRDQLGRLIGVKGYTIMRTELGHQNLGKSAWLALAKLAAQRGIDIDAPTALGQGMGNESAARHKTARPPESVPITEIAALIGEADALREQAAQVAAITGVGFDKALETVIRLRLDRPSSPPHSA